MGNKLGRGLNALISEDISTNKEKVATLNISDIEPNNMQPRKSFNDTKMEELMNSIREKGVVQPILVRQKEKGYEIIAGERRWRAAKNLGFETIPAIIKNDISDILSFEIALIENIQREDFDPIEEAEAYSMLIKKFDYSLEQAGQVVGRNKTTISNSLRILNLPGEIKEEIIKGRITTGHAKVLLSVPNEYRQKKLAQTVIKHVLSVRQLERMIDASPTKTKKPRANEEEIKKIEEELQHYLGTRVTIRHGKKRGKIEIQFFSNTDFDRIISKLYNR